MNKNKKTRQNTKFLTQTQCWMFAALKKTIISWNTEFILF